MTLRLYWSPDSANLVIRMTLGSFGLPFEASRLYRHQSMHKAPDYLAKNPQGLIPVLEDGDLVLFETGAILLHLCEKMGRMGPDGPAMADPGARGAFLKWLFYLSNTPHAELRMAFYTGRYVSDDSAVPLVWGGLANRRIQHLDLIESQLPETGGLLGPVTVLEIYLAAMIRWWHLYGGPDHRLTRVEKWPRIHALMRSIEERPAIRSAFASEMIGDDRPLTAPSRPQMPAEEITATSPAS
ncbi:MAG: glutathione S-transferase family protein [Pseudomonadota bacterium]